MLEPAAGAAVVIAAAVATLGLLRVPLVRLLAELCRREDRAQFWWRVAATELLVGTALCASLAVLVAGPHSPWSAGVAIIRGGCAGLIFSVAAITFGTFAIDWGDTTQPPGSVP